MIDGKELRSIMGRFATGVTVITTRDADGKHFGLTANAVASISLDPPLVMISIDKRAESLAHFDTSKVFAINILGADQEDVSTTFATSGIEKFEGISFRTSDAGVALLDGCIATLECRIVSTHDAGDHVIHLGEVDRTTAGDAPPLLFYQGRYGRLAS